MTKASDNVFPKVLLDMQTSAPAAPSDADWKLYAKPGGIYARSSNSEVGPFGLGGWTTYTPVLTATTTNPTLGSSTIVGHYKMLDATTMAFGIRLSITTGGAWNAGSGVWLFSLPSGYAGDSWGTQIVSCVCYDNGTRFYPGIATLGGAATTLIGLHAESGNQGYVGHNQPVTTWATSDYVAIGGIVRVTAV